MKPLETLHSHKSQIKASRQFGILSNHHFTLKLFKILLFAFKGSISNCTYIAQEKIYMYIAWIQSIDDILHTKFKYEKRLDFKKKVAN